MTLINKLVMLNVNPRGRLNTVPFSPGMQGVDTFVDSQKSEIGSLVDEVNKFIREVELKSGNKLSQDREMASAIYSKAGYEMYFGLIRDLVPFLGEEEIRYSAGSIVTVYLFDPRVYIPTVGS